jgi:predicted amidohydrolase
MSLSGSVDPAVRPDRLLDLDGPHVRAVVASAAETGVACCFGLAERHDQGPYITQVLASRGEIVAVQRKGLLGEDEAGFACSPTDERAVWGRFSVAICAEGDFDPAWEAGTDVVLFCAAPGLYDDMATGVAWWEDHGVGQACRRARQRRVWVALATQ